jgi:hypothetical protein
MLYPTYGAGGAFYAYCADGCSGYEDIEPVLLPTEGTVGNAALALTREGKPRALLSTLLRVYYAECDANSSDEASWSVTPTIEHQGDQELALALTVCAHDEVCAKGITASARAPQPRHVNADVSRGSGTKGARRRLGNFC